MAADALWRNGKSNGCGKDDVTVCLSLHINNHDFMQKTLILVHKVNTMQEMSV